MYVRLRTSSYRPNFAESHILLDTRVLPPVCDVFLGLSPEREGGCTYFLFLTRVGTDSIRIESSIRSHSFDCLLLGGDDDSLILGN